jgi:hypothetical protein
MDSTDQKIRHVVFYLGLRPGNLMLVEMLDGNYRILHNDVFVEGEEWPETGLEDALGRYNQLKVELS